MVHDDCVIPSQEVITQHIKSKKQVYSYEDTNKGNHPIEAFRIKNKEYKLKELYNIMNNIQKNNF
jgi:hypothetical protein